jgi:hypothetical protein
MNGLARKAFLGFAQLIVFLVFKENTADESVQVGADLPGLVGRFNVTNIKLDKCGGLTE